MSIDYGNDRVVVSKIQQEFDSPAPTITQSG